MKALINIKADKEVKEQAQKLASELGLTLSAVINAYLKQFIRRREVHFSTERHMTPELEAELAEVEEDIKAGRNMSPGFSSGKEMDEYLDSL